MKIFYFFFMALVLVSCQSKKTSRELSSKNLPVQSFTINPITDTVVVTRSQVRITILKGSFPENGLVSIEVKEAISNTDMILAGLTTTADSILLASGGMIYINGTQNGTAAQIRKPIEVAIPTKNYNPEMLLFKGEEKTDSSMNWVKPEILLNKEERNIVTEGQTLFRMNCASCHSIDKVLSGPALAYVTERRCMDWLKKVTKNTPDMISKDICMDAQQKLYNGQIMPAFPLLADSSIEAIYAYTASETEKLSAYGTKGDAQRFDPCNNLIVKDTIGFKEKINTTKKTAGPSDRPNLSSTSRPTLVTSNESAPIDTEEQIKEMPKNYYTFTIDAFGWFNIDMYADRDPDFKEGTMFVSLTGSAVQNPDVYLIVPSKKISVRGNRNNDGKYYFYYQENGYVQLPQNVTAFVIVVEGGKEESLFGKLQFTTKTNLDLQVEVNENANVEVEIRSMNLDKFQVEIQDSTTEKKLLINERIYQFTCPQDMVMKKINESEYNTTDSTATVPIK